MSDNLGSPAQRLMGCRTKTLLPTSNKLLQPKTIPPRTVTKELRYKKERQKHYYDKHSKLEKLRAGDQVMMRDKDRWKPAKVISRTAPRSYIIKTSIGQIYRRNRRHLRKSRKVSGQVEHESTEEWSDDDVMIGDDQNEENTDGTEPIQQNLNPSQTPQTTNPRRSQRIKHRPARYADSEY